MTTTDHAMHELPTLPTNLLMLIGEYGMARSDKCTPIEVTHRWLLLIDGIKAYATDYARAAIQQAAGAVPEGCRIVPIEPTESMLVFVHRLAWINAVNASPSPLGREAGSSDHVAACDGDRVQVPLTDAQIQPIYQQVQAEVAKLEDEGRYTFAGWFPVAVRLIEAAHGINPGSATGEDGHE